MNDVPLVLLVDDEPAHLRLMEIMLIDTPYDFLSAESASEALALLREHTPDLIVMDINMPGLSGMDIAGRIRRVSRLQNSSVLLVTSHVNNSVKESAKWEGVAGVLQKPLPAAQFLRMIEQALGKSGTSAFNPALALAS